MQQTANFNLNIVEGGDLFNPLTQTNPNFEVIDETMHDNQQSGITVANHSVSGTLHALVRTVAGVAVMRFTATGDYRTGDTFTVDGQPVQARLPDGSGLPDYAFRVNSNVICIQAGGVLTVFVNAAEVDTNAFMLTAQYVGSGAPGKVQNAVNADNATASATAANATNLGGNPSTYYAPASQLQPMIQNITSIQVVSQLPSNPSPTGMYLVPAT